MSFVKQIVHNGISLQIANQDMPRQPGMYLMLFHGRSAPDEQLDNWGSNGPILGPLCYVHTTYASSIAFEFATKEAALACGFDDQYDNEMQWSNELIHFNNVWYGDMSVFYVSPEEGTGHD